MEAASKCLIPVTLELGGKNPVIVEPDISISMATKTNFFSKASHPPVPIPWPSQTANKVARAMIKGIEKK